MSLHRHANAWHAAPVSPSDVRQAFDRFFEQHDISMASPERSRWTPHVDIREYEQQFVIMADVPGVDPAQIEVSMDKNVLSIKGERVVAEGESSSNLSRSERASGSFHRQFSLPDSIDAEAIVANGKFGVLEIVIPKKAQPMPRRITINASH